MKLYTDETGHQEVRAIGALVVAQIARVEVPAALWGKQRSGAMTATLAQELTTEFEDDWSGHNETPPRFAVVALSPQLLDEAARLCAVHGLRAYDGVHLSAAVAARRADSGCSTMTAFDRMLRVAAAGEGFTLVPTLDD